jgi:hypothetical protein
VTTAALETRALKAMTGALALLAAVTTGVGATLATPFGALAALAMTAGVCLAASLELLESDPHRGWRLLAWCALAPGWMVLAVMLLNRPLQDPVGLRLFSSVLFVAGAALRLWHASAHDGRASPALAVALGFTLLALATTWSGWLLPTGETPITAIGIGCALELFGTGSFLLGEAWDSRDQRRTAANPGRLQASAVIHMA